MQNFKINKLKAQRARQHRLVAQGRHTQQIKALAGVKASIEDLYSLSNARVVDDYSKYMYQIHRLTGQSNIGVKK